MKKVLNGVVVLSGLLLLVACGNKGNNSSSKNLSAELIRGSWLITSFKGKKIEPDVQSIVTVDGDLKFQIADVATNTAFMNGSLTLNGDHATAKDNAAPSDVIVVTLPNENQFHLVNSTKDYFVDGERISDSEKAAIIAAGKGR